MNKQNMIRIRWILVALFVLAAGCFYSCGSGGGGQEVQLAEVSGMKAETGAEPETARKPDPLVPDTPVADTLESDSPEDPGGKRLPEEIPAVCYVHVCGQVLHPGVYRLMEGQRIYEAVEAAGGFTPQASRTWLNLAEKVWDGMQLEVPDEETVAAVLAARQEMNLSGSLSDSGGAGAEGRSGGGGTGSHSGNSGTGAGGLSGAASEYRKVNINTATRQELMGLKGIGETRAEAIITYRQEQGYFQKIEDIMKVPGIKDAAFQKIRDDITV